MLKGVINSDNVIPNHSNLQKGRRKEKHISSRISKSEFKINY